MAAEVEVRFPSGGNSDTGTFKLLELPPDLCSLIESSINDHTHPSLTIKGLPDEDAVLCTANKTYTIRSVVLSNSILVVTPDPTSDDLEVEEVVIRDQLTEVLELIPSVPRLHKLDPILRGREYDEGHEDEDMVEDESEDLVEEGQQPIPKRKKFTYEDARATIQASDEELDRGLKERRVLILNGELRPIAPSHLTTILELILNSLVSLSLRHDSAPVETLASTLEYDHDIPRSVSSQVMVWFGNVWEGKWTMDVNAILKGVGLGILRAYKDEPIPEAEFMRQWRGAVGDTFADRPSLALLQGNYLVSTDSLSSSPAPLLTYFPSASLPVEPAARFADLFLTRARWKVDDISPFLADIVVDNKERDKLLLKYARAVTDSEGIWFTARSKS